MTPIACRLLLVELRDAMIKHDNVAKEMCERRTHCRAMGVGERSAHYLSEQEQKEIVEAIKEVIDAIEAGVIGVKEEG